MPSRTDSFGILYLEAWLYRKPVIGARAWGMSDVIRHGEDGLLVPFGDVPALAEAIGYLLDHPEIREAMGTSGEVKARTTYHWDRRYALLRDAYVASPNRALDRP
jgi:glycosyltransferase involved in cell wall biosynthesis